MEVEYELTPDDMYAFQWRAAFESPRSWRTRRKIYLLWLLALVLFALLPSIGSDGLVLSRMNLGFVLLAFPVVVLLQLFLERSLLRRAILQLVRQEKPGGGQLGGHKMALTPEGVLESTAVGESRTTWAGVDRVEQNPDYIFIYTSAAAAHVIPKRAFRVPDDAERFYQLSKASKEAAK
jgi:hypothetical protein